MRGEVSGEFKNIFNSDRTLSVASGSGPAVVVPTDAAGMPLSALPADASGFAPTANSSWVSASGFGTSRTCPDRHLRGHGEP
jgi:hypothetical protein